MSKTLYFNVEDLDDICERAKHWALTNGLIILSKQQLTNAEHLPFTLFPSPYSESNFLIGMDLQPFLNTLIYDIGTSPCVLERIFSNLNKPHILNSMLYYDEFISKLWSIYKNGLENGYNQSIHLLILRTDYMLHKAGKLRQTDSNEFTLKQVEINTMSAGFGFVGGCISKLHKQVVKWTKSNKILPKLPDNSPLNSLGNAFVKAWNLYNNKDAVILYIVLDNERNISDQRHLEYTIRDKEPQIDVLRCTLANIYDDGCLDENKALFFKGREVAIVYFRAGYSPHQYETNKEWDALNMLECSKAIKTPSIGVFLAGMKCVQLYLYDQRNLSELIGDNYELMEKLQSVFGKFYDLKNKKNIDDAIKNPQNYVLKPQREGGSNNYYDAKITEVLLNIDKRNEYEKERFVLMERFNPMINENYIIRSNTNKNSVKKEITTTELGIFGVLVRDENTVYLNEASGYCLRSKPYESYECGVMSGSGAVDSVYFTD